MRRIMLTIAIVAMAVASATAFAADQKHDCQDVRFGYVNWPGVTVKTRTAQWMLQQLGYQSTMTAASTPVVYQSLARGELDAFMAQWMPSQRDLFRKFGQEGTIDIVSANLRGGKYTLGVPAYVYDAGVKSIKDLDAHKEEFGGKIYGIDAGSGGNTTIKRMMDDDYAGLGDWKLIQSSTASMMVAVGRHIRDKKPIVFLAWTPHPMNVMYDIRYLAGGAKYWGPNKGEVIVNTLARTGYAWDCPNVGQFLDNYKWTPKEQSAAMAYVLNDKMDYLDAGKKLIREHPDLLERWFDQSGIYQTGGITTADGKKAAREVVAHALGLK